MRAPATLFALTCLTAGCLPPGPISNDGGKPLSQGDGSSTPIDMTVGPLDFTVLPDIAMGPPDLLVVPDMATTAPIFSENFDSLTAGTAASTANWNLALSGTGAKAVIDSVHAMGKNAMHFTLPSGGYGWISPKTFSPPNNSFWGRMRVWVATLPTAPDYAHFTLVEAKGTGDPSLIRPLGGQYIPTSGGSPANASYLGVGTDGGGTGDWLYWKNDSTATGGAFMCLEWNLQSSGAKVDVYINGTEKTDLSVTATTHGTDPKATSNTLVMPTFNNIWFGWWLYDTTSTPASFDVWIDDVAVSTVRLGC